MAPLFSHLHHRTVQCQPMLDTCLIDLDSSDHELVAQRPPLTRHTDQAQPHQSALQSMHQHLAQSQSSSSDVDMSSDVVTLISSSPTSPLPTSRNNNTDHDRHSQQCIGTMVANRNVVSPAAGAMSHHHPSAHPSAPHHNATGNSTANCTGNHKIPSLSASANNVLDLHASANQATIIDYKTCPVRVGEETIIEIVRDKIGLGLSIAGGSDKPEVRSTNYFWHCVHLGLTIIFFARAL